MKRLIFCAALVMAALASCSKTEVIYDGDSQEIGFKVAAGPMSKAPIEGTTLTSGEMVVYAFSSSTEDGTYTFYFDNQIFTYQDSYWKGETPQYWPSSGYLKFMAYYPSGIGTATGSDAPTPNIQISDIDNASAQNDILYTALSDAQSAANKADVPMTFKHALAQILVTFKATHPGDNIVVTSVEIEKPNLSGDLTLNNTQATWSTSASANDLTMNKELTTALTADAQNYGSGALVMPGGQTKLIIKYTINSGAATTETITLSGTWDMGKKYIYNITFANEILISATVDNWDAVGNFEENEVNID